MLFVVLFVGKEKYQHCVIMFGKSMKSLSINEMRLVSGGDGFSSNPCYRYVDCTYINGTLSTKEVSKYCQQTGPTIDRDYTIIDTYDTPEMTTVTFLVDVCSLDMATATKKNKQE